MTENSALCAVLDRFWRQPNGSVVDIVPHCLVASPPTHSPLGRCLYGLRRASIPMLAMTWTSFRAPHLSTRQRRRARLSSRSQCVDRLCTDSCHTTGTQELRGGLAIGEHDLARIHVVSRTEVTAIIGLLSFRTECPEASHPRCGLCFDLAVVRIDLTRPFPSIEVAWDVVPLKHGSVSGTDAAGFDRYLGGGVE